MDYYKKIQIFIIFLFLYFISCQLFDIIPPEVKFISVTQIRFLSTSGIVEIKIEARDKNLRYVELYDNGIKIKTYEKGDIIDTLELSLGEHNLKAKAFDKSGNFREKMFNFTVIKNEIPNIPIISGKATGYINISYEFTAQTTDPDGDSVSYQFDWGDGNLSEWSEYVLSGVSVTLSHSWSELGTYNVRARAKDIYGNISDWSSGHQVEILINNLPNIPSISGPTSGYRNISYNFTAQTTDPDGDSISYQFDWGDGNLSEWSEYVLSGVSVTLSHSWSELGTYNVRARAKDTKGGISDWSNPVQINISLRWRLVTFSAPWSGRWGHTSVVFDNKIWVLGGYDGSYKNDVWCSSDGVNWVCATSNAPWSGRRGHTSVVYDNKIWVLGGWDGSLRNDVWCSSDGVNWVCATSNAPWSGRWGHTSVVYDNKIWVLGGWDGSYRNDVWYSSDGVNWVCATSNAPWSGRYGHTSVVFDNKIWVLGGWDGSSGRNDVWYSSDGINWICATHNAPWSRRYYHTSVVFDNKIWVLGGGWYPFKNDGWCSSDGINWVCATNNAPWLGREGHTSLVYDNKIWVLGGDDGFYENDVWCGEP